jgi:hypothetical protein
MNSSLAIIFSSFEISGSRKFQMKRVAEYKTGISSILRNLPDDTLKILVDNTGYLASLKEETAQIFPPCENFYIHSYRNNIGSKNKGLGELEMFQRASQIVPFDKFHKIFYLTGRYFYTNPYAFEKSLTSDAHFIYSKPNFLGINGEVRQDGAPDTLNDMFFCGSFDFVDGYLKYFALNKERMKQDAIPSERLLWEYFQIKKRDLTFLSQKIESIGIIRKTSKKEIGIDDIQVL